MTKDFDTKLRQYAEVLVRVGTNVQPGKKLIIWATLTDEPSIRKLVHYCVETAYKDGARYVEVFWDDQTLEKIRLENAPDDSLEEIPSWQYATIKEIAEDQGSRLNMLAWDPDILAGQDPERIATINRSKGEAYQPIRELSYQGFGTRSYAVAASQIRANRVLPELPEEKRLEAYWDLIFSACHIDKEDPVRALKSHSEALAKCADYLNDKAYDSLHYRAPGTDLRVGLVKNHIWKYAFLTTNQGVDYVPNVPSEEVFTMPDCNRVDGTVSSSMPLNYRGSLIDGISITFKDGKAVEAHATTGEEILHGILDTDEGAKSLGEVALVSQRSPIAQMGRLFYDTLYDENASCHFALGFPILDTIKGGEEMSPEELSKAGGNSSLTHVDFMIGSDQMDIDGISADGTVEPVMRGGEWAFDVQSDF